MITTKEKKQMIAATKDCMLRLEAAQDRYIGLEIGLMEYAGGNWFQRLFFGPKKAEEFLKYIRARYDRKLAGKDPDKRTGGSDA